MSEIEKDLEVVRGNLKDMISLNKRYLSQIENLYNRINKAIEYIENDMPYLQEVADDYEDVNGETYFTYKDFDESILLNILKGVDKVD